MPEAGGCGRAGLRCRTSQNQARGCGDVHGRDLGRGRHGGFPFGNAGRRMLSQPQRGSRVAGEQDLLASGGREGRVLAGGAHVPHRVAHRSSEGRRGLNIGSGGEAGHRWGAPVLTNDEAAAALSQCRHGGQMEDSGLEAWGVVRGAGLMLARGGHPGAPPVLLGRPPRRS